MKSILKWKDFIIKISNNWFIYQKKSLISCVGIGDKNILTRRDFDYLTSNCVNLICLSSNILLLGHKCCNKNWAFHDILELRIFVLGLLENIHVD